ncbi:MAG: 3-isopropylmalate dehydratase small subunit, partial [Pirellulales bacterium]|nr:3-isopropylmalate dehydratase small subunit [Pirellulales bacterium]
TDQIIPKQFLKKIERTGFGQHLFHDWRFHDDGSHNPEFELNHPHAEGASVLLARANFGCGSSREHAPWALEDYGFRVIIAPSFADIFFNNCFKNGMLPIVLEEHHIDELFDRAGKHAPHEITVCLESCKITDDHGLDITFEVDGHRRHCLLHGLDDIGQTLEHEHKITAFEAARESA